MLSSADEPLRKVRLVVLNAGNPGPAKVGFHIELESGWHLYWVNPGDAGLPPNARWTLPPGFTAGPLRHPIPARSLRDGLVSFEHEDQVLLLCEISPSAGWPSGPWEAAAVLEWMACRESCITGEAAVRAVMPPDAISLAEGKSLLEKFASRFPRPLTESGMAAGSVRAEWTGSAWRVEVALAGQRAAEAQDFFAYPVEGFVVDNAGVSCRDGRLVCPLIPSRGPGSPPPAAIAGVLVVAGSGYEISVPVPSRRAASTPRIPDFLGLRHPRLMDITSWR